MRSAPQKHPMAMVTTSVPSGQGPCNGVPRTSCVAGMPGSGWGRPGRVSVNCIPPSVPRVALVPPVWHLASHAARARTPAPPGDRGVVDRRLGAAGRRPPPPAGGRRAPARAGPRGPRPDPRAQGRLRRAPRVQRRGQRGRFRGGGAPVGRAVGPPDGALGRSPRRRRCRLAARHAADHAAVRDGTTLLVDVGSTFTKAALVDDGGGLVARTSVPTTVGPGLDVLDGVAAAHRALTEVTRAPVPDPLSRRAADGGRVLVCSSAGGGLRLAVVGYER